MEKYISMLHNTPVFKGFELSEMEKAVNCLKGKVSSFKKRDILRYTDDSVQTFGIILEGSVYLNTINSHGERQIFSERKAGELFGENCLWEHSLTSHFEVEANEDCKILYIEKGNIISEGVTICSFRQKIIENLFHLLLANNQSLYQKIDMVTQKSLREQIMYYFRLQEEKFETNSFDINFTRQEFADYLGVDRSSLSRELAKMKAEEIINYEKNHFQIL